MTKISQLPGIKLTLDTRPVKNGVTILRKRKRKAAGARVTQARAPTYLCRRKNQQMFNYIERRECVVPNRNKLVTYFDCI